MKKQQPTIALLPTEAEIAGVCIEIHLELTQTWTEMESIESYLLEPGSHIKVKPSEVVRHQIDLHKLSERSKNQHKRFYSAIEDWFIRAGIPRGDREIDQLSKFSFEQQLYDFKNRCKASPLAIEMIKGVRRELQALYENLIPDLVSVIQEWRHADVPARVTPPQLMQLTF